MLTTKDASKALGVSTAFLRRLAIDGKTQATKFADRWMWSEEAIDRLRNRPKGKVGRPKKK